MLKRISAVAALLMLVAGCSGEDPEPDPEPEPTSEPNPDLADAELCGVVDAELVDRLADGATPAPALMLGSEEFIGCDLTGGTFSFAYGVRVIDDGGELTDYLSGEPQPVDDLGDEAFAVESAPDQNLGETIVARAGDRVVYVRNELLQYGAERSTTDDTRSVVQTLLDLPQDEVAALEPVDVAAPCPAATDVEAVIGTVVTARGAPSAGDDDLTCLYRAEDGSRVYISVVKQDDAASDFIQPVDEYTEELELPGAQQATISADESMVGIDAAVADDEVWSIEVSAETGGLSRDDAVDFAEKVLAGAGAE